MIDYVNSDLFLADSVDKQILIEYDGERITNTELFWEEMEITESLNSEENLVFGSCEASTIKFRVANIFSPMEGKWITVTETLARDTENPFQLGKYKVLTDEPTADRRYRNIVAYDAMYDIINSNVAEWYNTILPEETSMVTMKQFRDSFASHFGLEQEEIKLVNDSMTVSRTIQPEELSGKTVITAICEINGCFGHIGRDGKLHYIYLAQAIEGLYPSNNLYPSENLFPREPKSRLIRTGTYIPPCQYEDYVVDGITQLQIRKEENEAGVTVGAAGNLYVIQNNFLVYGNGAAELTSIANNVLEKIKGITYRPFSTDARGNPCIEVGDAVRLSTRYQRIESYVLQRTLKGIQALRDSYEATGEKERRQNLNSTQASIMELKGKTNKISRTVEENRAEVKDIEQGLETEIYQAASELRTEALNTKLGLETRISQNAEAINIESTRAQEAESSLGVRADSIELSVTNLQNSTVAQFAVMGEQISAKVSSGEVQSMIDISLAGIKLSANQISLEGYTTINGGFSIDTSGNATLQTSQARAYLADRTLRIRDLSTMHLIMITPDDISFSDGAAVYRPIALNSDSNRIDIVAGYGQFAQAEIRSAKISYLEVDNLITSGSDDTVANRIAWLKNEIVSLKERVTALESA